MAERIENKSFQHNRAIMGHLIKAIWPVEFLEQKPGSLSAFDERLRSSHGAVGLIPHFSKGDFQVILCGLLKNSKELIRRPILIPIAAHQRPQYLDWLCKKADINLATIITLDTRKKAKQLQEKGRPIPWEGLDPEAAMDTYLNRVALVLNEGGVVLVAPQGGRRGLLTPFKGKPVARLEEKAQEMGIHDLAYFTVGLEIPGTEDYSQLRGLNIRRQHRVTLGQITNRNEVPGNIDSWGYQAMLELAPPAYRPQRHV